MLTDRQKAALLLEHRRRAAGGILDLLTWTMLYRRELGPGKPFNLRQHRYLTGLYECTARRMVVYKAGQMGASEYLVSYALHACDQRQATVLYVFPTDTHVSDFSSARIGPAIEASEYLAGVVVDGVGGGRGEKVSGANRVTLKRVRDRFLYLRGGKVSTDGQAAQLKSIDADCVVFDEWDEMDPRAPRIGRKRLGHSAIAEERAVSTPTYPGIGIHAEWLESDQREWVIPCPHCGHKQFLTIAHVVREWDTLGRPVGWNGGPAEAWAACERCGGRLDNLAAGEWVPIMPGREAVGFHLSKLFSPVVHLLELVRNLDTVDETARREAFNQDLGVPYQPRGGQLTDEVLDDCRRDYGFGPLPGVRAVMGVDVGRVLHGTIRAIDPVTGENRLLWAGAMDSFEEMGRTMRRFNVGRLVVDALPETTKAREFQAGWPPGVVWLAYYVNQKVGTKYADPMQWDKDKGVVNLDRTRALDGMFAGFYEGSATLPANIREVKDYYAHLKAQVRVLENGPGGEQVARYVESEADHLGHAENYCRVAMSAPSPVVAASSSRVVRLNL